MSIYRSNKKLRFFLVIVLVIALAGGLALSSFAVDKSEEKSSFRKIWMQSWRVLNFLILAYFLVRLLRKPLTRFFEESARVLREHLQGTEEACIEAERQLEEVERRLKSLDEEIRELQRVIAQRGERDRDKIIANAKATAEHILEKAKLEAGYRVRQARRRLRHEVVDVAISLTEESIRKAIDSRDQQRLVEEYLKDLRQMPRLTA